MPLWGALWGALFVCISSSISSAFTLRQHTSHCTELRMFKKTSSTTTTTTPAPPSAGYYYTTQPLISPPSSIDLSTDLSFTGCKIREISAEDSETYGIKKGDIMLWIEGVVIPPPSTSTPTPTSTTSLFLDKINFGSIMSLVYPTGEDAKATIKEIAEAGGRRFGFFRPSSPSSPLNDVDPFLEKYYGFDSASMQLITSPPSSTTQQTKKKPITITIKPSNTIITNVQPGSNLLTTILSSPSAPQVYRQLSKFTNCGGKGKCGTCLVKITSGNEQTGRRSIEEGEKVRTASKGLKLEKEGGWEDGEEGRLACWTDVFGDLELTTYG